jgi:putative SOS response-associated peptidase YedK
MCGRYQLQDPEWVEADFSQVFPTLSTHVRRPRYNIAPGQLVLGIGQSGGARALEQLHWGIAAPWKNDGTQLINARGEKLSGSRLWKPMLKSGRVALPATGFYEWKAAATKGAKKQPFMFTRNDGGGFWFAGLASPDPDGDGRQCVIVTVEPNELVEDVHDRMPAMLNEDQLARWLSDDVDDALAALLPYPSVEMTATAIGTAIGSAAKEGPELIEPVELAPPAQGSLL